MPGNPIERCAIKKFSDNRYNTLRNIVNGVDRLIDESDEDTLELLRFRYWDCPIGCYEWEDIAHYFGTSKTSILRRRNALIDKLAKYIEGDVADFTLCKSALKQFIMLVSRLIFKVIKC